MKLYYSPTSPYVRKVMVVLHETGQLSDVELVAASGTPLAPADALLTKNPLTKVPALERPGGPTLVDSRVICRFLDERGKGGLYPKGAREWDAITLEALADGILDAALLMTYEARLRPEAIRWPEWADSQWAKVERSCKLLNQEWMPYLAEKNDIGQIALACALSYADFRHAARSWRSGNDTLAAWFEAYDARPAMQATRPPEG